MPISAFKMTILTNSTKNPCLSSDFYCRKYKQNSDSFNVLFKCTEQRKVYILLSPVFF